MHSNFSFFTISTQTCDKLMQVVTSGQNIEPVINFFEFINQNFYKVSLDDFHRTIPICKVVQLFCFDPFCLDQAKNLLDKINFLRATLLNPPMPLLPIKAPVHFQLIKASLNSIEEVLFINNSLLYGRLYQALDEGVSDFLSIQGENGYTLLHYLSFFTDLRLIHILLNLTKQIDRQDNFSQSTPLHFAYHHEQLIYLLVDHGANIALKNSKGETFVDLLLVNNQDLLIKRLANPQINPVHWQKFFDPLVSKAFAEKSEKLICLILTIIEQNQENIFIEYFIYFASCASLEVLQLTLAQGVSIDAKFFKERALDLACIHKNLESVQRLVAAGANTNYINPVNKYLAIDYALQEGDVKIAEFLMANMKLNFVTFEGTCFAEILLSTNSIAPKKIQKLLCKAKTLNPSIKKNLLSPRLVATIWGSKAPTFFEFAQLPINYMGLFPYAAVKKLNKILKTYLPTLIAHFPNYFNEKKVEALKNLPLQLTQNSNLAQIDAEKILINSKSAPQILLYDNLSHLATVVLYGQTIAKCNRGYGSDGKNGITIYRSQLEMTEEMIEQIRTRHDMDFFCVEMDEELQLLKKEKVKFKPQRVGNCTWTSLKTALYAVLVLISNQEEKKVIPQIYKSYSSFARFYELKRYLKKIISYELKPDWLLLTTIRLKIEKKLTRNLHELQRENFEQSLKLMNKLLTKEFCKLTIETQSEMLHYFIAAGWEEQVKEFLKECPDFDLDAPCRGMYLRDTAAKKLKLSQNLKQCF